MDEKRPPTSSILFAYVGSGANVDVLKFSHEKDLFKKYGLQMTLMYVALGPASTQGVTSGATAAATAPVTDVLTAVAGGAAMKIIMVNIDRFDHRLVAKTGIKSAADLKGKKLAVSRLGSFSDIETRSFLRQSGLNPDSDVQYLELGNAASRAAALCAGQVDAAMVTSSFLPMAKKGGFNVIFDMSKTQTRFANRSVVASDRLIKEQPHAVKAIVAGFVDGTRRWKANPEEAKAYLKKSYRLPDEDTNELYLEASRIMRSDPTPDLDSIQTAWESIATLKTRGPVDLKNFIDGRFVNEVLREMR